MDGNELGQQPLLQSVEEASPQTRLQVVLTACALAILLAVPASRLDTRELSAGEADFAQRALGSLENDARGSAAPGLPPAADALLGGWAILVGTTERPLKLLVVISLVLAALVTGEVASRLAQRPVRVPVYLLFAASPFLNRSDLLHPGLVEVLPAAFVLGGLARALGGAVWWLAGAILGCFVAPFFGGTVALVAALLAAVPLLTSKSRPTRRSQLLAGLLLQWSALAAGLLICRASGFETRLAAPTLAGASPSWVLLLPAAALVPAVASFRLGRGVERMVLLLLLALVCASSWVGRNAAPGELRRALDDARSSRASGGRFVVWGPHRMGILFYGRRGHDPALPILAVPEDVEFPDLAELIRHQLRIPSGKAPPGAPPILIYPLPAEEPPGFTLRPIPGRTIAILDLVGG